MVNALLIILASAIIVLVLIQPAKSGDAGSMLAGGSDLSLFKSTKSRGGVRTAEIITWALTGCLFAILIWQKIMG